MEINQCKLQHQQTNEENIHDNFNRNREKHLTNLHIYLQFFKNFSKTNWRKHPQAYATKERHPVWKKEIKVFAVDIIVYVENRMESTKNILEIINELNKIA